ncbi:MAG TPA: secondary thiamine-phosphate synthase enzyme YjbQ [Stenomitos sp.]
MMQAFHHTFEIQTQANFEICDLTPSIQAWIATTGVQTGQLTVIGQHTTTALAINENETRLWEDIRVFLQKIAPAGDRYLHDDLHLRDVPEDEPINAHSHLMALLMNPSVVVPIVAGRLGLGTYQSILMLELDGPRQRKVLCHLLGL